MNDFLIAGCLAAALATIVGIAVVALLVRSHRKDKQRWCLVASNLHCPKCQTSYDDWDGAVWGVDSDPPDARACNHGVVLICPSCHELGLK